MSRLAFALLAALTLAACTSPAVEGGDVAVRDRWVPVTGPLR